MLLTEEYLEEQKKLELKYGKNVVLFMELGSFYEIYEANGIGKVKEISNILNILQTKKNKNKPESQRNPLMCGVPSVSLDKHLNRLAQEEKWTIAIMSQTATDNGFERKITEIISPGTNVRNNIKDDTNSYLASLILDKNTKGIYSCGLSLIDVTTGNIKVYEGYGVHNDKEKILDEVNLILENYNIKELILLDNLDSNKLYYKFPSINMKTSNKSIHYKIQLITETFNKDFSELGLEQSPYIIDSLVGLLEFLIDHNKSLVVKLNSITFINNKEFMYLGNNPLKQLNIIGDDFSVEKLINKGISAIGRRYIREQILNPIINADEINNRYKYSLSLSKSNKLPTIEKSLKNIYDIERLSRKLELKTIKPFELGNLVTSLYASSDIIKNIKMLDTLTTFESYINLDLIKDYNSIHWNFFKDEQLMTLKTELELIMDLSNYEFDSFIKYSDKDGYYYEFTNKKYENLSFTSTIEHTRKLKNSIKLFTSELSSINTRRLVIESKMMEISNVLFKDVLDIFDITIINIEINKIQRIEFYLNNTKLLAKKYCIPTILDDVENIFDVTNLRHPLVEHLEQEVFVPNSIKFNKENKGYLLYGQNSSGKTVLSKSIGIAIILAQSGFFVPAESLAFTIKDSLFTRIIGADNINKGLSTFAVEMLELKNILNRSTPDSMIIGDEISHGTETTSGVSIVASAILHFNAPFIIATHLHQLDSINDIKEKPFIHFIHLALTFDTSTNSLIYNRTIQKGKGSSIYGLEFAKSLDMPFDFLDKAYAIRKEIADDISGLEQLTISKPSSYNSKLFLGTCYLCDNKGEEVHHIKHQHLADDDGFIDTLRKNHKSNLMVLCSSCHNKQHEKKI